MEQIAIEYSWFVWCGRVQRYNFICWGERAKLLWSIPILSKHEQIVVDTKGKTHMAKQDLGVENMLVIMALAKMSDEDT